MYYDSYFYYWLTALLFIVTMMFILFICLRNYYITLWHVRTPTLEAQAADNLQRNISHLDLNASEVR